METCIQELFERYASVFNRSLAGEMDMNDVASLYASDFIAASPAGVTTGKNDDQLSEIMAQGYARYREMGTKEMRFRDLHLTPIDGNHWMARVAWTAIYARSNQSDVSIDFDIHYFVQILNDKPKVFGWVSGDEQALLKEHDIV